MKKKLRLNRETLRHLDPQEAAKAAGGQVTLVGGCVSSYLTACCPETINTTSTLQCTGEYCTNDFTFCLCQVC